MEQTCILLSQYSAFINAKARRIARDAAEADELAQKASIILWQRHSQLSALSDASIKAYLNKTLRNTLIDIRRQERPMVSYETLSTPLPSHSRKFEDAVVDKMAIMAVIHRLSAEEQDILFKAYFMDMDSSEIGIVLSLPPSTIRSKKLRAMRKLKNLLQKGVTL